MGSIEPTGNEDATQSGTTDTSLVILFYNLFYYHITHIFYNNNNI